MLVSNKNKVAPDLYLKVPSIIETIKHTKTKPRVVGCTPEPIPIQMPLKLKSSAASNPILGWDIDLPMR